MNTHTKPTNPTNHLVMSLLGLSLIVTTPIFVRSANIELDDTRPYGRVGAPALSRLNVANNAGTLYEVRFEPDLYIGDLLARTIATDGTINQDVFDDDGNLTTDNTLWRASTQLNATAPTSRKIFTAFTDGASQTSYRFDWSSFPDAMKNLVDPSANVGDASNDIVDWVRGDSSNEGVGSGDLRSRTFDDTHQKLADLIHSSPQYVGPPTRSFSEHDYSGFRFANRDRVPMVYVGANDGMLHAFNAATGDEEFAYVPEGVLEDLEYLTDKNYTQNYYVDGSPTVSDAYGGFGTHCSGGSPCWRTVLVAGLNTGGESIYALDITDPQPASETAARGMLLWEFFHTDLGASYSKPVIAKLSDGTWVAIFGNGLHEEGAIAAKLFIVALDTGLLAAGSPIEVTPPGPALTESNGLLSPAAWDVDNDGDVDYVYSGDTEGNLWRFDLASATRSSSATVSFSGDPLITVTGEGGENLVITTAPQVTTNPGDDGGRLVYFGTGKLFEDLDTLTNYGDAVFAVEDTDVALGADPTLVEHTLTRATAGSSEARYVSATANDGANRVGWKLILEDGERVINDMILVNKRLTFTSINPTTEENENWINTVDFISGKDPDEVALDINEDGDLDGGDLVASTIPVSLLLGNGIVSSPRNVIVSGDNDLLLVTHGLKRGSFDPPFNDPGLVGGHFDLDTFDAEGVESCWGLSGDGGKGGKGGKGGGDKCHTHKFDDDNDVDGVNMLVAGGEITDPPNVETATGILSSKHRALLEAMQIEQDDPGTYDDDLSTFVYIHIVNPYSVDTPALFAQRMANGVDDDGQQDGPATIYFQCGVNGTRHILEAPDFNALPVADRGCVVGNITELRIRFPSINSLRATKPGCVKGNETGPILPVGGPPQNTSYRDGAIVVQVIRGLPVNGVVPNNGTTVIYENANYEHLNKYDKDAVPDGENDKVECGVPNEHLRAYKEPEDFGGDGGGDGDDDGGGKGGKGGDGGGGGTGGTSTDNVGQQITGGTVHASSTISTGRVSWREVIDGK